ncbi:DUF6526 family protein [Chryseobacterium sp.]|uniref:DUF6526 family protein n=1 Tax=Chryseobacterium sp. TaxID=1871047 RepID=UPI0025BD83AD|nr:DUF6526 family protein [Chryseobacterium sp.]
MKPQDYKNHRKYYVPHHFIYLPLLLILEAVGLYQVGNDSENRLSWILFSVIIFLIFYLAIMLRQHYALGLQDRLLRLEFKQRYFEIFSQRSDDVEEKLKFDQIAALRFTYDEEFKELLYKALHENISGDQIKRSIQKWRPDHHRV